MWQQYLGISWHFFIYSVLPWSGWGVVIAGLTFIFYNGEAFDQWIARIDKFLIYRGFRREKSYILRDIRGRINKAAKKINREAESVVTKKVELVWVDQDNIESFLRKGRVIIRMKQHENQDKNVANAVIHYVQRGILHTGKIYLSPNVKQALDLALARKILEEEPDTSTSLEFFTTNILEPKLSSDTSLAAVYSTIELMEEKGLLTRVLLREIRSLGKKLYPRRPDGSILKETDDFFEFLKPFANHGASDDIDVWIFTQDNIQIGMLYVAKANRLTQEGLEPYMHRLEEDLRLGCKRVYIFGKKEENVRAVNQMESILKHAMPHLKISQESYVTTRRGYRLDAICTIVSTG